MSYVTVFTKVSSATEERPCVTTQVAEMLLKSHSNCSRNTIKILNYDYFPTAAARKNIYIIRGPITEGAQKGVLIQPLRSTQDIPEEGPLLEY